MKTVFSISLLVAAGLWSAILPTSAQVNVTQFHNHSSRDGLYIDPAFTQGATANLTRDVNTALTRKKLLDDNKQELLELLKRFDTVLNIFGTGEREMLDGEIQSLIDERQEARRRRDFGRGDEIRDELAGRGIILEDTKDGVRWKRK